MAPAPGTRARFGSLTAALAVVLALWPLAPCAAAGETALPLPTVACSQTPARETFLPDPASNGIQAATIHGWLTALRFGPPADARPARVATPPNRSRLEAQRGYRGRRGRGDRGVAGLVLGAIGGFAAGGAIGVAVGERYCHCQDPGLHGFIIGAPIGAVIGGFVGYALTR